ncbi:MAG: Zn-dependent alcohol dehydrogenase [Deinococcales bacterium]
MKAAVCYEFGKDLLIEDVKLDSPRANEVKVTLKACAICHSDIHYAEGAWGGVLPAVYGHEAAGVISEVGSAVKGLKVGDHVVVSLIRFCGCCYYCNQGHLPLCESEFPSAERLQDRDGKTIYQGLRTGAFAEEVVVDRSQVVVMPKSMPFDSASLLACGVITGLGAVTHTAKVPFGSSVVVIGAGGVGLNSLQGARLMGAEPIIALDVVPEKLETAKKFGATYAFNAKDEGLKEKIHSLTQGRGADFVFVTVGSVRAMEQGLELLRRAGSLVMVGMPASGAKMTFEAVDFADAAKHIMGSKMGSIRPHIEIPKLIELYLAGRLKLDELISNRYPLDQINQAIHEVKQGQVLRNVILF